MLVISKVLKADQRANKSTNLLTRVQGIRDKGYCLTEHKEIVIIQLVYALEIRAGIVQDMLVKRDRINTSQLLLSEVVDIITHKLVVPVH